MRSTRHQGLLAAFLAALLFGTSPVLTRWASASLSSSEITFGRLAVGGAAVGLVAAIRGERFPHRSQWLRYVLGGLGLAVHFLTYVAAIRFTTLAHTLTIVYCSVVMIALISHLFLAEKLRVPQWGGVLLACVGLVSLTGFETQMTRRMLLGDLMALGSAATFAIYTVMGRHQRRDTSLFAYTGSIYLLGALWSLPFAVSTFSPSGYTWQAVGSVVASGLLPMGLGHTLYNAALRSTNATVVNLISMQEVVIAVLAGSWLFGEIPTLSTMLGVGLTLVGVVMVLFPPGREGTRG